MNFKITNIKIMDTTNIASEKQIAYIKALSKFGECEEFITLVDNQKITKRQASKIIKHLKQWKDYLLYGKCADMQICENFANEAKVLIQECVNSRNN